MTIDNVSEAAKAVVRRNTVEVQGGGNFKVFDELSLFPIKQRHWNLS